MKTVLCGLLLMMLSTGADAQAPVNDAAAIQILDHMSAVIGELGSCSFTLTVSRDVNDADLGLVTRHSVDDVCMVGPDKMLIKIRGDAGHRERIAARLPESVQSQRLNSVYAARGRRRDAFHLRCGWKAREDRAQ